MPNTKHESEEERARLLTQRDELRERLQRIEKDLRQPLDADSQERAIQLENREVLEGIARAAAEDLARVEQRLAAFAKR